MATVQCVTKSTVWIVEVLHNRGHKLYHIKMRSFNSCLLATIYGTNKTKQACRQAKQHFLLGLKVSF